jgi:lantibiotic modifying enzyme
MAHKLPAGHDSVFSYWQDPEADKPEIKPARMAWCYGDPGIAATLLYAARCVNRQDWEQEAIQIALSAAAHSVEKSGVVDAGLCHGAAGLAHIYNRIWQATGADELAEAARFWYQHTLAIRQPQYEVAGFPAYRPIEDAENPWTPDAGLLTGAAGVGLALLAGVSSVEPVWDRMLLTSIPLRVS